MISVKVAGDAAPPARDRRLASADGSGRERGRPIAAAIRAADLPGVIDVVPGAATVLVTFEPGSWSPADLADAAAPALAGRRRGADLRPGSGRRR